MAKKVLVLLGSPRQKGNSAILAEQITKGANVIAGEELDHRHRRGLSPGH